MKKILVRLAVVLAVLGVVGFAVAASGVVPIKASAGHLPPVRWFLSFAMSRSVSTYSLGTATPALDDPGLVLRGAGHYETGCRWCHGAPGMRASAITAELTPEPPFLPDEIDQWESEELFYIVKHGVKMTGMPAWPARERDDEVWAVVAFLLAMEDMDEATYRELAFGPVAGTGEVAATAGPDAAGREVEEPAGEGPMGEGDAAPPPEVLTSCARCHGVDGAGRGAGAFPRLDGQRAAYLEASLRAYASGERASGIMEPVAADLDAGALARVARHYARSGAADAPSGATGVPLPSPEDVDRPGEPLPQPDPRLAAADLARGERLARRGSVERKIPACTSCHGPVEGAHQLNPAYPHLAGQDLDYLLLQLELFRAGHRGGSPYADLMRVAVERLEPREMLDIAAWYASLPWDHGG